MDCGQSFPYYCMDFDHRSDEEKKFDIERWYNHGWEAVKAEVKKCDLICACCHRHRTAQRRGYAVTYS